MSEVTIQSVQASDAVDRSDQSRSDSQADNRWREVEFTALREEILALGEAERNAVRFYIPATAIVYAVPYYVSERMATAMSDPLKQAFMWTFCVLSHLGGRATSYRSFAVLASSICRAL